MSSTPVTDALSPDSQLQWTYNNFIQPTRDDPIGDDYINTRSINITAQGLPPDRIQNGWPETVQIFLDLFAGSGAVGREAFSRGARYVDFVENGPAALHSLKANVAALRATKRCRIFKKDALPWIRSLEEGAYGIAFVDAPYGSKKLDRVIEYWRETPFADILILEHHKEHEIGMKGKRYDFEGATRITLLRKGAKAL